jgi:TATA-box binding protein (TBP) (component of TFIID and TFIIIB)
MKTDICPKPTDLVISTCTVVSNVSNDIDLNYLSRVVPIYDMYDDLLEEKIGGIYNITLYSDYSRGNTYDKKVKNKEFNNQVTIKYKYWGFRYINMKIFTNGKLQMTGLKTNTEADKITSRIISILKNISLNIYPSKKALDTYYNQITCASNSVDVVETSNKTEQVTYDAYQDGFKTNNNFLSSNIDSNTKQNKDKSNQSTKNTKDTKSKNKNKNNSNTNHKEVHKETTESVNNNTNYSKINSINEYQIAYNLKENTLNYYRYKNESINNLLKYYNDCNFKNINWLSHKDMTKIIAKLEEKYGEYEVYSNIVNDIFTKLREQLGNLSKENDIKEFYKKNGYMLVQLIGNFNAIFVNHEFKWDKCIDVNNENSFQYICNEFGTYINQFHTVLRKSISKIKNVNKSDLDVLNKIKMIMLPKITKDIENIDKKLVSQKDIESMEWSIKMKDLYMTSPNYHISSISTELINSDYSCGFCINLNVLSAFLKKKYGIYNSYKPDEYPGVLTKYYYHPDNKVQGICACEPHCSSKDKKSKCCKITISIFRPGSIIITGAKSIEQLKHTYGVINGILKDNYKYIKGTELEEDTLKKNPNDNRKICRKPRLFYIEKSNVSNLPCEYVTV